MAKIVIDASRMHSLSKSRGIGVYAQNLNLNLPKVSQDNQFVLATSRSQVKKADLIHYPTFDLFFLTLPQKHASKFIVTVHDIIPLVFPKHFPKGIKGSIKLKLQIIALKKAARIITDSHHSKKDIIDYLNIPASIIDVIYLGVSPEFKTVKNKSSLKLTQDTHHLKNPFILYVGDVNYNKNLKRLLRAFASLDKKPLDLVMVTKAWSRTQIPEVVNLTRLINQLGISNRVIKIPQLADDTKDLINLYNLSEVYIQPSLYEGFGLPVLEAMACGTPVVATDSASLPEVTGQATITVKPSVQNIARGINQALSLSPTQRQKLIAKGKKQSALFNWEKTAKQTLRVYNQVLKNA